MPKFTVYFEICNKHMKLTLTADNVFQAQVMVEQRLNIIKVEKVSSDEDDLFESIRGMFK